MSPYPFSISHKIHMIFTKIVHLLYSLYTRMICIIYHILYKIANVKKERPFSHKINKILHNFEKTGKTTTKRKLGGQIWI